MITISELKQKIIDVESKVEKFTSLDNYEDFGEIYFDLRNIIQRVLVKLFVSEIEISLYNELILKIEDLIREIRQKDSRFKENFNKREYIRSVLNDYNSYDSNILIEPEVQNLLPQTENKIVDQQKEILLLNEFKKKMKIIEDINDKEDSLFITSPN